VDDKDIECETRRRIKHFQEVPGWRNWQTQRTQKPAPPGARAHAHKNVRDAAVLGEKWRTPGPTDLIIPKWQRELFKTILDEENLRFDREGRPRTAYSLRLTYICLRLMEGADIYQIAKNCRTSVEMIEKYYAAHIKTSLDAAAINVMRSKKFKKRKPKGGGLKTPTQA
jgi:hypothetical protein